MPRNQTQSRFGTPPFPTVCRTVTDSPPLRLTVLSSRSLSTRANVQLSLLRMNPLLTLMITEENSGIGISLPSPTTDASAENAYATQPKLNATGAKPDPLSWARAFLTMSPPMIRRTVVKSDGFSR